MKKSIVQSIFIITVQLLIYNSALAQGNSKQKKDSIPVIKGVGINKALSIDYPTKKTDSLKYKNKVFEVFDEEPRFMDGDEATFIRKNLVYPKAALDSGISGIVTVSFIISIEGEVSGLKALRKIPGGCTEEAMRIVNLTNRKWRAGRINGQAVNGLWMLNIKFSVSKDNPKPKN